MNLKPTLVLVPLFLASCGGGSPVSSSSSTSASTTTPSTSSMASSTLSSSLESGEESSSIEAPYELNLNVAVPAGAPAIALYRHLENEKVEVNADPANVVGYLSSNSDKDVVICPTNAGLASITKKNAPYKIAATLTFGNFYLASTGNDENKQLDPTDYVVAFQKGNVPDKIFSYVYEGLSNVHYVTAASDALQCLISGKNSQDEETPNASVDYVLMAEPALTNGLSKNENAAEYANIQTEFAKKSNGMEITQASIFVSNSAKKEDVDLFLSSIGSDVTSFLNDPDSIDPFVSDIDASVLQSKFSAPLAMVKKQTKNGNRMGLGFKLAYENRPAVENFVSLFGISGLNEEVYYQ